MFFKKTPLLFFAVTFLFASVLQARPQVLPAQEITAKPRPSHPRPSFGFKSNVPEPHIGEGPDSPIVLDKYDYLEAVFPVSMEPNLQLVFNSYYDAPETYTFINITPSEKAYLFTYHLVYDRWADPCTSNAYLNSFVLEPSTFTFQGTDGGAAPGVSLYYLDKPVVPYRDDLDSSCPTDKEGNPVDLQDGDLVDVVHYLSLQSECLLDSSEQSPLCPAYRLIRSAFVGIIPIDKNSGFKAYKYSSDPDKGGQPDEVRTFDNPNGAYYETSPDLKVLPIKFKVQ